MQAVTPQVHLLARELKTAGIPAHARLLFQDNHRCRFSAHEPKRGTESGWASAQDDDPWRGHQAE